MASKTVSQTDEELDLLFINTVYPRPVTIKEDHPNFHAFKVLIATYFRVNGKSEHLKYMNENQAIYRVTYLLLQRGETLIFMAQLHFHSPRGDYPFGHDSSIAKKTMELFSLKPVIKVILPKKT